MYNWFSSQLWWFTLWIAKSLSLVLWVVGCPGETTFTGFSLFLDRALLITEEIHRAMAMWGMSHHIMENEHMKRFCSGILEYSMVKVRHWMKYEAMISKIWEFNLLYEHTITWVPTCVSAWGMKRYQHTNFGSVLLMSLLGIRATLALWNLVR